MGASNIGGHQKDRKSWNKSLGSAKSGGRTAAADLKREPVLTTTHARRSRWSDRTETWRAPSRPSARSGNASNQPIGLEGRTGVSSSNSVLPTKSQVHFCNSASVPGGFLVPSMERKRLKCAQNNGERFGRFKLFGTGLSNRARCHGSFESSKRYSQGRLGRSERREHSENC